jgi:hypothetical protein
VRIDVHDRRLGKCHGNAGESSVDCTADKQFSRGHGFSFELSMVGFPGKGNFAMIPAGEQKPQADCLRFVLI